MVIVGESIFAAASLGVSFEYEGEHGSAVYNGNWTADFNGIGIMFATWASSGASSWWYIKDNTINVAVGNLASAANSLTNSTSFPIIKGHTYSSSDKRNVTTARFQCFRIKTTQAAAAAASKWELMWENPSPDSSFAAQKVYIDLSDKTELKIVARRIASQDGTLQTVTTAFAPIGVPAAIVEPVGVNFTRYYQSTATYIDFGDGGYYSNYAGWSWNTENVVLIPWKIYAI